MNIYVGNLAKDVTDQDLMTLFAAHGTVKSVKVISDMFTGESKGFGFVEMNDTAEATKAMNELNTQELKGKKLIINEARPKTNDRRGGGGPGHGGRGGSGGSGNSRGGNSRGGFGGGNSGGGGKRW